ncbi:MAG: hypothetical protein ACHQ2E_01145 [Gemmatimonadales bacterium]
MGRNRWIGGTVLLCALGAVASPALAQGGSCGSQWKTPPVGSWSEWQSGSQTTRIAVVGTEKQADTTLYDIELSSGNQGTMQLLVPAFPWNMDQVHQMIMQRPGQPPMKMSGQMLAMMKSQMPAKQGGMADLARRCASMTVVGVETITVPAGTFKTTHLKDQGGEDVWASGDVPFAVVKHTGSTGVTVLSATGKDAKSAITGTPVEMQPGMMGPPPKN